MLIIMIHAFIDREIMKYDDVDAKDRSKTAEEDKYILDVATHNATPFFSFSYITARLTIL